MTAGGVAPLVKHSHSLNVAAVLVQQFKDRCSPSLHDACDPIVDVPAVPNARPCYLGPCLCPTNKDVNDLWNMRKSVLRAIKDMV